MTLDQLFNMMWLSDEKYELEDQIEVSVYEKNLNYQLESDNHSHNTIFMKNYGSIQYNNLIDNNKKISCCAKFQELCFYNCFKNITKYFKNFFNCLYLCCNEKCKSNINKNQKSNEKISNNLIKLERQKFITSDDSSIEIDTDIYYLIINNENTSCLPENVNSIVGDTYYEKLKYEINKETLFSFFNNKIQIAENIKNNLNKNTNNWGICITSIIVKYIILFEKRLTTSNCGHLIQQNNEIDIYKLQKNDDNLIVKKSSNSSSDETEVFSEEYECY